METTICDRGADRDLLRLPSGHARSTEVHPAAPVHVLRRCAIGAAAGGGHGRARTSARRLAARDGQGWQRRRRDVSADGGCGPAGARTRAVRHLLRALPRPDGLRRRHDRSARVPPARVLPHRPVARRAAGTLRRRHAQRLRRDGRLCRQSRRPRSLGDRRLHPRAAAQPARDDQRRAHRRPRSAPVMALQQTADELIPELRRVQPRLLIAGGAGLAASAIGGLFNPAQFFQSYLMAYMLCLGTTLGCLALGMVHQLSGGAWGVVLRRPIGGAVRVLPVLTALFLPILFGMSRLYVWTHADVVAADEVIRHKRLYLNVPFFIARAALYFLIWNAISYFLNAWSLEQDRTGDPRIARRMQRLSAGGLVAYGLTITFASFDWLMSLSPDWYSTIYGVLIIGGQGLSAMAFLILAIAWLSRRPPLDRIIMPEHF